MLSQCRLSKFHNQIAYEFLMDGSFFKELLFKLSSILYKAALERATRKYVVCKTGWKINTRSCMLPVTKVKCNCYQNLDFPNFIFKLF